MIVTQHDIAHLSDDQVKLIVVAIRDMVGPLDATTNRGLPDFWRRLALALIRARRDRAGVLAALELDALGQVHRE